MTGVVIVSEGHDATPSTIWLSSPSASTPSLIQMIGRGRRPGTLRPLSRRRRVRERKHYNMLRRFWRRRGLLLPRYK